MNFLGGFPSIVSRLGHLPQRTVVIFGPSSVVSTLYIGPPASGKLVISGDQELKSLLFPLPNVLSEIPKISIIIPKNDSVEDRNNQKFEGPDRVIPEPNTMQIHPENMIFRRMLESAN